MKKFEDWLRDNNVYVPKTKIGRIITLFDLRWEKARLLYESLYEMNDRMSEVWEKERKRLSEQYKRDVPEYEHFWEIEEFKGASQAWWAIQREIAFLPYIDNLADTIERKLRHGLPDDCF